MVSRDQDNLIGEASSFLEVLEHVSKVAPLNKPVLVVGERGTGKELIAARIHYLSSRWDQPFLKLNCAAINDNLLETELFGHESGAFTGAGKKHIGRFELADNGTLFLDELATTSPRIQEKLLRVIEYGEFERVGGNKTIKVDVRLIAATNEDLPLLAEQGKFRPDLLDRLAFDVITLPPLRERREDIMKLAQYFAIAMTKEMEREFFAGFTATAEQSLLSYNWPGNIRELKNVIERMVYRSEPDAAINSIEFDPFASPYRPNTLTHQSGSVTESNKVSDNNEPQGSVPDLPGSTYQFPIDLKESIQNQEIELIKEGLKQAQFNQKKCAELLGLTYHQLRGYLKKYSLLDSQES